MTSFERLTEPQRNLALLVGVSNFHEAFKTRDLDTWDSDEQYAKHASFQITPSSLSAALQASWRAAFGNLAPLELDVSALELSRLGFGEEYQVEHYAPPRFRTSLPLSELVRAGDADGTTVVQIDTGKGGKIQYRIPTSCVV